MLYLNFGSTTNCFVISGLPKILLISSMVPFPSFFLFIDKNSQLIRASFFCFFHYKVSGNGLSTMHMNIPSASFVLLAYSVSLLIGATHPSFLVRSCVFRGLGILQALSSPDFSGFINLSNNLSLTLHLLTT